MKSADLIWWCWWNLQLSTTQLSFHVEIFPVQLSKISSSCETVWSSLFLSVCLMLRLGLRWGKKNTSHSQLPVISDELPLSCLTPFDYLLLVRQNVVQKSLQCVRMSHDFFIESGKFYTTLLQFVPSLTFFSVVWKKRNIYEKKKKTVNVIATANCQFSSISARFDQVDATLIMSLSVFFYCKHQKRKKRECEWKIPLGRQTFGCNGTRRSSGHYWIK